jgi:hypothetical protein
VMSSCLITIFILLTLLLRCYTVVITSQQELVNQL